MIRRACLPLLAVVALVAAEEPIPAQFRVWGTTFPGADEPLHMPACYSEVVPPAATVLAPPSAAGLLPFRCHPQGFMHPRLVPDPAALADPQLSGFATRGAYEPLALGLYAAGAVQGLRAGLSPLVGPAGATIPASNLDLRWVRFMPNPAGRLTYRLDPLILEKRPVQNLAGGTAAFVWITVAVPASAVPGIYAGSLRLEADGLPPAAVPLRFRVLGFALPPADRQFAMLYNPAFSARVQGEPARVRDECVDMAEHGMNALAYLQLRPAAVIGADGTRSFTCEAPASPIAGIVAAAMDAGLTRGIGLNWVVTTRYAQEETGFAWGTPDCDAYLRASAQAWQRAARVGGWPPLTINIADEPNEDNPKNRTSTARHLATLVKQADPTIRTQGFCTGVYHQEDNIGALAPFLDVPVVMPFSADYLTELGRRPQGFMLYNQAWPERPLDCRIAFGWMPVGTGAVGVQQFMYRHLPGERTDPRRAAFHYWPETGFTDLEPAWCYSWPGSDGLLPNPAFEAIRAGIDDLRYVQLARTLAISAVQGADPGRRSQGVAALARIEAITDRFPTFLPSGALRGLAPVAAAGAGSLDAARWELAELIEELRAAGSPPSAAGPARLACGEVRDLVSAGRGAEAPAIGQVLAVRPAGQPVDAAGGFGRFGDPSPGLALHQSTVSITSDDAGMSFTCWAAEDHADGPQLNPGAKWWDDGNDRFEMFLASPAQDGVVHQLAGLADGRSAYVLHRRQTGEVYDIDQVAVRSTDFTGMHTQAVREAGGWRLSMRIPWAMLRLGAAPLAGEVWGLNVCRSRAPRSGEARELSGWVAPMRRFLEPGRFGRLVFGADPGVSGSRAEIAATAGGAVARLVLRNLGAARRIGVIPELAGRALPAVSVDLAPGRSEVALRLPALTPPCQIGFRLELEGVRGPLLAMAEVAGESAADLVVAGVGTQRAAWQGRPTLPMVLAPAPGTVLTSDARAFLVRLEPPLPGIASLDILHDGRLALHHEAIRIGAGGVAVAVLAEALPPGIYQVRATMGDLLLTAELRVVAGWLTGH